MYLYVFILFFVRKNEFIIFSNGGLILFFIWNKNKNKNVKYKII